MCKFKLFSIAAAALMMVACSNEDLTQQTQTKAGKMQFSATIAAPSSGATTRTIYTEDTQNKKITVAWKVDDEIALVHNGVKDVATVKTINSDGSLAPLTMLMLDWFIPQHVWEQSPVVMMALNILLMKLLKAN